VRLPTCFICLACVLDAWSRRCVGWQLSRTIDTQLTLAALNHAFALRRPERGLIDHSDRGVQYAASAYVERLTEVGAQISMSAKGNPYGNARAESFFKTLLRQRADGELLRYAQGRTAPDGLSQTRCTAQGRL
jgi:transposase InsO family protein